MEISLEKFEQVKTEAEAFYKLIGEVLCPYFKENVSFNTKGLEHLKFSEKNKARVVADQYTRLRLLPLASKVLKMSHTLQDFYETRKFEKQNINSQWQHRMVKVCYYGFVAIINNVRVKIIVKQIEGGNKYFWSLIPFWKLRPGDFGNKKILHAGDMEND